MGVPDGEVNFNEEPNCDDEREDDGWDSCWCWVRGKWVNGTDDDDAEGNDEDDDEEEEDGDDNDDDDDWDDEDEEEDEVDDGSGLLLRMNEFADSKWIALPVCDSVNSVAVTITSHRQSFDTAGSEPNGGRKRALLLYSFLGTDETLWLFASIFSILPLFFVLGFMVSYLNIWERRIMLKALGSVEMVFFVEE